MPLHLVITPKKWRLLYEISLYSILIIIFPINTLIVIVGCIVSFHYCCSYFFSKCGTNNMVFNYVYVQSEKLPIIAVFWLIIRMYYLVLAPLLKLLRGPRIINFTKSYQIEINIILDYYLQQIYIIWELTSK